MHFSSYHEFYQKALIPMGEKDRVILYGDHSPLTHWLISLEGHPKINDEYFVWEVAIYPADIEGTFNWNTPLYRSSFFDRFDEALETAKNLEYFSRDDLLSSINIEEKII